MRERMRPPAAPGHPAPLPEARRRRHVLRCSVPTPAPYATRQPRSPFSHVNSRVLLDSSLLANRFALSAVGPRSAVGRQQRGAHRQAADRRVRLPSPPSSSPSSSSSSLFHHFVVSAWAGGRRRRPCSRSSPAGSTTSRSPSPCTFPLCMNKPNWEAHANDTHLTHTTHTTHDTHDTHAGSAEVAS
jgi:hypothetical protein